MTVDPNAKRERARRLATDYSVYQRQRDEQDRNRGAQRRGPVSEGRQTLNRQVERIERPTLSETTADKEEQKETKVYSGNTPSGRPKSEAAKAEKFRNSSRVSHQQEDPWS